jgi:hypothetical protein
LRNLVHQGDMKWCSAGRNSQITPSSWSYLKIKRKKKKKRKETDQHTKRIYNLDGNRKKDEETSSNAGFTQKKGHIWTNEQQSERTEIEKEVETRKRTFSQRVCQ